MKASEQASKTSRRRDKLEPGEIQAPKGSALLNAVLNDNAVIVIAGRGDIVVASLVQVGKERVQGFGPTVRDALYNLYESAP